MYVSPPGYHRHRCQFCSFVFEHHDCNDIHHGDSGVHECPSCHRCLWSLGIYSGEEPPRVRNGLTPPITAAHLVNAPVPPGKGTGLVPRDFKTHPVGCFDFAQPFPDDQLIPEDEWKDRLAAQQGNSLLDLRNNNYDVLHSLDQNGYGLCHTADTEVLTERGWVAWPDYNWSDLLATVNVPTGMMEFQTPLQRHAYEYDGEMIHSTNRRLDFGVTPEHRMLVRKWDEAARTLSGQYTFQPAGKIGWYAGMMHAPSGWLGTELVEVEVPGDRRYDGDDFIALLSLIVSDGFAASYEHSGNLVSFASFRPECRDRVAALAARVGFREQPSRPGVWNRWGAGALAQWVFANCYTGGGHKARHKRVPDLVKVASRRQIEHFLTWNGDQNHKREAHGEHYYSTSKRMIDDIQELCLRVGRRGTITHRDGRTAMMPQGTMSTSRECWELIVARTENLCIDRKKHIEQDRYKGTVFCATVPNGTLVTRRNGSVLISGNCWAFSSTKATMYLRAIANEPLLRLSAYFVAGNVKNWRDEGGYGAESLEWIIKHGAPIEALCPTYRSSNVTNECKANAEFHRVTEWWDGSDSTEQATKQMISCLLRNQPCVVDLNDMGHSMNAIAIESLSPLTIIYDNSWGEQGDHGLYRGTGARARPDGLVIPRVTLPSQV